MIDVTFEVTREQQHDLMQALKGFGTVPFQPPNSATGDPNKIRWRCRVPEDFPGQHPEWKVIPD